MAQYARYFCIDHRPIYFSSCTMYMCGCVPGEESRQSSSVVNPAAIYVPSVRDYDVHSYSPFAFS